MRRSLSGGSGGMGCGGGGMLKNVHRAVRAADVGGGGGGGGAAHQEQPFSPLKTPMNHTLNSLPRASNILTLSTTASNVAPSSPPFPSSSRCSSPVCSDESEWECVDGREDEEFGNYFYDDNYVFGTVPSLDEVHHAFSALQQVVFEPAASPHFPKSNSPTSSLKDTAEEGGVQASSTRTMASVGSTSDWMEPSLHICSSRMPMPYVPNRVYDAFHLMQTEPAVKRMVVSLSSDKAVWDAVLNNEAVQELRDSLKQVNVPDQAFPESTDEESVASNGEPDDVWGWIFSNAKATMKEIIDKVMTFITDLFQHPEMEKASEGNTDPLDQHLKTSFFLSVLVLLIVVVSRAQKA